MKKTKRLISAPFMLLQRENFSFCYLSPRPHESNPAKLQVARMKGSCNMTKTMLSNLTPYRGKDSTSHLSDGIRSPVESEFMLLSLNKQSKRCAEC
jgi:hypothetical protein